MLFSGQTNGDGLLQNTSCVLPFGPAKKQLFNFAPAKLVWVLFWAVAKEYLARGARTAMPNQIKVINIIQPEQKKSTPDQPATRSAPTKKAPINGAF